MNERLENNTALEGKFSYEYSTNCQPQVDWSWLPMYDKYNEDGFLIIHGCPNFASLSIEQCNPNFNVESFTEVLALQDIRCPLKYQFSCGKEKI